MPFLPPISLLGQIYIHHLYGRYFFLPSFLPQSIYGIKVK